MPNFGENTRDFLQFPIYYYDVVYSQSLPVRGYAGAASVLLNGWDPIALAPSLAHVSAAGALSVEGTITATGGLTDAELRATPVPVSGTVTATVANLDVALSTRTKPSDQQHVIVDSSASVAVTNAGLTNLDVALSTRTKPADQQHVIIDSSASIAVTGPLTDTQIRATPLPVSGTVAVTGTFYQTTQPVSIDNNLPLAVSDNAQRIANRLLLQALQVAQAGPAGFVPIETPTFLVG